MASADKQTYDDRILTRYLLGALGDDETERLDELSIADDDFASRLQVVEDDLVNAYVRGELAGETLEQFRSFYLSSGQRREKVQFAEALFRATYLRPPTARRERSRTWLPEWALAAAACLLLAAVGFLLYQNLRLRDEMKQAQAAIATLRQHVETAAPPPPPEKSSPQPQAVQTVAVVLAPLTRGSSAVPVVALMPTDGVALQLELESNDFPRYRASLKDPAAGRVMWRSDAVKASSRGQDSAVFISVPAGTLKQQNYMIELTGISAGAAAESVANYAFGVVMK
jgi:hypothetical protein